MMRPLTSIRHFLRRNRVSTFHAIILLLLAWPLTLYISLAYLVPSNSPFLVPASLLVARRPLLVTAHPDDESLFFGPTVLGVGEAGNLKEVRILVLSSGNNDGLGSARKSELTEACRRIGAKECLVLDRTDIQDNPKKWWDQDVVKDIVKSKVKEWNVDALLTFDSGGVSGHINHRAVSAAVVDLREHTPNFPPTFILRTVPTFLPPRKYIGIFDLPFTTLRFTFRIMKALIYGSYNRQWSAADLKSWEGYESTGLFVSSWATWRQNVQAFWAHESQRSWDRWVYMVISRYMWFNDIVKINPIDAPVVK